MPAATPGHIAWTLATCLEQMEASEAAVKVLFICHNKELACRVDAVCDRFVAAFPSVCPGVQSNIVHDGYAYAMDWFMIRKNGPLNTKARELLRGRRSKRPFSKDDIFCQRPLRTTAPQ